MLFKLFDLTKLTSSDLESYSKEKAIELAGFDFRQDAGKTHIQNEIIYNETLNNFFKKGYEIQNYLEGKKFEDTIIIKDVSLTSQGDNKCILLFGHGIKSNYTIQFTSKKYSRYDIEKLNKNDEILIKGKVKFHLIEMDFKRKDSFNGDITEKKYF